MTENAQIDDELYNSIFEHVLRRLSDKVPAVRVQAALAISRLQDPSNKECPVINGEHARHHHPLHLFWLRSVIGN